MRLSPRSRAVSAEASSTIPAAGQCAFRPFDILSGRCAILFDQIAQQRPERLAPLVFRQDAR
jgi:hypothetical protein